MDQENDVSRLAYGDLSSSYCKSNLNRLTNIMLQRILSGSILVIKFTWNGRF